MQNALFAVVTLLATLLGAIFGIGGGVIIKPAVEAFSGLPLNTINTLSGITVLCMAAVSLLRYLKSGAALNLKLVWLSLGAVAGGFAGKYLFDLFRDALPEQYAKALQYALLIVMLVIVVFKNRFGSLNLNSPAWLVLSGLLMGTVSAFLGIGGGPINLLVLYAVLGIDAKKAAVYSVFVILCSQVSLVGLTAASGGYAGQDLRPLLAMIPAAVAGGLIGPVFHKRWDLSKFERNFNVLMLALIALNVFNIVKVLIV